MFTADNWTFAPVIEKTQSPVLASRTRGNGKLINETTSTKYWYYAYESSCNYNATTDPSSLKGQRTRKPTPKVSIYV